MPKKLDLQIKMGRNGRAMKITYGIHKIFLFIFYRAKNNAIICGIFFVPKKWLIKFTLYTLRIKISIPFQKCIGLYALEFFILVKTSRHRGIHFVRNYFYMPGLFFSCKNNVIICGIFFVPKKWLIKLTLYTLRINISIPFQKCIGLYALEFFIRVKTLRHWGTHFVRNYFYLKFIWPLRFGLASLWREFTPWFGVRWSSTYTPLQALLNFLHNAEEIRLSN